MSDSKQFANANPAIAEYAKTTFLHEDSILLQVKQSAQQADLPPIYVNPMDGLHLQVLTRISQASKVVEIGTFVGYSTIWIARGLTQPGQIHTIEIDPKIAEIAQHSFATAGISDFVKIHIGEASEILEQLKMLAPFDLVFIDADKVSYPLYLKWAIKHLRVGGVVMADNTFAFDHIADKSFEDPRTEKMTTAIREFNFLLANDPTMLATILPTGEGLTVAVKHRA